MMRWMFRFLAAAAIVFAAGISGTWLGEQMRSPLPVWWGWFGAVVLAAAVFGGVYLAARGDRAGYAVVVMGALGEVTLDWHFFGYARHDIWTAAVLASFPTLTAILAGAVEARFAREEQTAAAEAMRDSVAWQRELERERLRMEHRRELARIKAAAVQVQPVPERSNGSAKPAALDRPDRLRRLAERDEWTAADVAAAFGISERQARRDLNAAGFRREGKTWRRQQTNEGG